MYSIGSANNGVNCEAMAWRMMPWVLPLGARVQFQVQTNLCFPYDHRQFWMPMINKVSSLTELPYPWGAHTYQNLTSTRTHCSSGAPDTFFTIVPPFSQENRKLQTRSSRYFSRITSSPESRDAQWELFGVTTLFMRNRWHQIKRVVFLVRFNHIRTKCHLFVVNSVLLLNDCSRGLWDSLMIVPGDCGIA